MAVTVVHTPATLGGVLAGDTGAQSGTTNGLGAISYLDDYGERLLGVRDHSKAYLVSVWRFNWNASPGSRTSFWGEINIANCGGSWADIEAISVIPRAAGGYWGFIWNNRSGSGFDGTVFRFVVPDLSAASAPSPIVVSAANCALIKIDLPSPIPGDGYEGFAVHPNGTGWVFERNRPAGPGVRAKGFKMPNLHTAANNSTVIGSDVGVRVLAAPPTGSNLCSSLNAADFNPPIATPTGTIPAGDLLFFNQAKGGKGRDQNGNPDGEFRLWTVGYHVPGGNVDALGAATNPDYQFETTNGEGAAFYTGAGGLKWLTQPEGNPPGWWSSCRSYNLVAQANQPATPGTSKPTILLVS